MGWLELIVSFHLDLVLTYWDGRVLDLSFCISNFVFPLNSHTHLLLFLLFMLFDPVNVISKETKTSSLLFNSLNLSTFPCLSGSRSWSLSYFWQIWVSRDRSLILVSMVDGERLTCRELQRRPSKVSMINTPLWNLIRSTHWSHIRQSRIWLDVLLLILILWLKWAHLTIRFLSSNHGFSRLWSIRLISLTQ